MAGQTPQRPSAPVRSFSRNTAWAPYFFLAPFLLGFCIFMAYPLLQSVVLSLNRTYGPSSSQFIGLDNFRFLLHDADFWKAVSNTAIFAAGSVFIQLPCSLGMALLLNGKDLRARSFFRLIFFSPALVGTVFVAMMFGLILEKHTGLLNVALNSMTSAIHNHVGIMPVFDLDFPWLQKYIMPAMIIAALWMYIGFNMVYFLAALQSVNQEHVEAAMVDGASKGQIFWHVTLPAIRPVAAFVVLLSLIGSFQLFELPWVLLGGAGPDKQGLTVVMYLYQNGFKIGDLGYASAIGWVLALMLAGFAVGTRLLSRNEEA